MWYRAARRWHMPAFAAFVRPRKTERDMLRDWAESDKVEKVAGPIDWVEAQRSFRAEQVDFVWHDGTHWHTYRLKPGHRRSRKRVRSLASSVFHYTLHKRSAA